MDRNALAAAVRKLTWGYVFFYLDFNLGTVSLLPSFVFFILLWKAIPDLSRAVPSTALLKPLTALLGVWHGILWVLKIFALDPDLYLVTVVAAALSLYLHFQLLTNLAEIARQWDCPQEKAILRLRTVLAVVTTVLALPVDWMSVLPLWGTWIAFVLLVLLLCGTLNSFRKSLETEKMIKA